MLGVSMTAPEPCSHASTALEEAVPEGFAEAGRYPTSDEGFEHGLVVLAMGAPYWLIESAEGYRLCVPATVEREVRAQLEIFARERMGWPPPRFREEAVAPAETGFFVALVWVLAVMAAFVCQEEWPAWVEAGAMDARAVFAHGEWWRPVTALFLHADLGHLGSNVAGGLFLFSSVFSAFGRVRGACLLALAAVAGNLAAAAIHFPGDYRSIGASTAVFAGLGMLTGRAIRAVGRGRRAWRGRAVWTPLAAGLAVLGLFGAGDVRVDVLAHTTGFLAGLAAGLSAARFRSA